MAGYRFYEQAGPDARRSAPAALRNREPIVEVLREWLPESGLVLEIASGTGEHAAFFAEQFHDLEWQPSDANAGALASIGAWQDEAKLANLRTPIEIDASRAGWPIDRANAVLNINMVHISPWRSALGLLDGAAKLLSSGAPLILYGPWMTAGVETAPTNLAFDADLKRRNGEWGLREVEAFELEARARGFALAETRRMPANNLMLLFRKEATPPVE
jgi:hypothetical protein